MSDPAGGPDRAPRRLARSIVLSTLLGALTRFIYVAGWLVIAPYMLHRLGAERFGFWAILGVVSGLFLTFDFGVGAALTKFVAEFAAVGDLRARRGVFTLGLLLYVGVGVLWALALIGFRGVVLDFFHVPAASRAEMSAALVAAACTAVLLCAYTVLGSVLTGLQRLDLFNGIGSAVTLAQLVGVALLLASGRGLVAIAWLQAGTTAAGTLAAAVALRGLDPGLALDPGSASWPLWNRLTHYGGALQVINLGVLCQFQLPKILLGRLESLRDVAHYELGLRVAFTAWSVALLLAPPLIPALAHLDSIGDRERLMRLYRRASRYLVGAGFVIGGGLLALARPVFALWMGAGQAAAASVCAALGALMMVNMLTTPGCLVVRSTGRPWMEARYQIVAMVLHFSLALWLIPRLHLAGALAAMWISVAVGTAVFLTEFHRAWGESFGGWLRVAVWRTLAVVVAAGAVAWPVGRALGGAFAGRSDGLRATLGSAALYAVIVAVGLLASGALQLSELREIVALARSRRAGGGARP